MNSLDRQYKDLLDHIIHFSVDKKDRTGTGTKSIFGWQIRHNMKEGFPLLTTKKMYWKGIVTELLWFLRGETNIKYLIDNDCHIWDGDAYKRYERANTWEAQDTPSIHEFIKRIKDDETFRKTWGELGPIYGKQWRRWSSYPNKNGEYESNPVDQIQNLINELKTNPDSRRLMVSAWNVGELDQMVLPPCHYGFQVYTRELTPKERYTLWFKNNYETGFEFNPNQPPDYEDSYWSKTPSREISLMWNQRSVDTFLGLPFNIASYGLLLEILAEIVNMQPGELIGNLGDVHLYSNHIDQVYEQLKRDPYDLPKLFINTEFWAPGTSEGCGMGPGTYTPNFYGLIKSIEIEDFQIKDYKSHPSIKAPLSN